MLNSILYIIDVSGVSRLKFLLCLVMSLIASLIAVIPAQFLGVVISTLSETKQDYFIVNIMSSYISNEKYHFAIAGVFLFFVFTILSVFFRNIFCYFASVTVDRVITELRKKLFRKILRIDFSTYLEKPKGEMIYRVMGDTQRLSNVLSDPLYTLFSDLFDLIWIAVFLVIVNPTILLMLISIIPFLYLASIKTAKLQKAVAGEIQRVDGELSTRIEQTLSGFEMIKAFIGERYEEKRFNQNAEESFKLYKKSNLSQSFFFPVEGVLRATGTAMILIYAIFQIKNGSMALGMIAVLFEYTNRFYSPVRNISKYYQTIQTGIVSIKRIRQFLELPEETINLLSNKLNTGVKYNWNNCQEILLDNVSLRIGERNVLEGFNLRCAPGELILLKGPSGSGKTSILRILLGFYQLDSGIVSIGGRNIENISKLELRKMISYSSQNVFLNNDSLCNNLLYPENEIKVNLTKCIEMINLRHKKLDEAAGEDGKNLSGGEKARLAFARALLRNTGILILDEVTAGLDSENENIIMSILNDLKGKKTILLASHSCNQLLLNIADKVVELKAPCKLPNAD